jgi:uncharacterized protein YjbI with pentapeptide repeats
VLDDTRLDGATLEEANLSKASFISARLDAASLKRSVLTDANLANASLKRTIFGGADMKNGVIEGAYLRMTVIALQELEQTVGKPQSVSAQPRSCQMGASLNKIGDDWKESLKSLPEEQRPWSWLYDF